MRYLIVKKMSAGMLTAACCIGLAGCDVDVEDSGELPEVEVQEGEMPEVDVTGPDVDVSTEKQKVTVPDVDLEETEVSVPDVDVDFPAEDEN
ncbi:hypothetical protein Pla123a_09140 [Posidoniimonas polymericola]|uniref:Secreted protein n=1 Tax=Posidoniimonas polymericola TaxID=2528002 RepID=A0A5C5YT00_9BACT|nr:hypothetical protein [Posidoniimonas polymericola]TWT78124.1 hypothetical protein Pla123a_09140 [Posidoniimonas polymericola]